LTAVAEEFRALGYSVDLTQEFDEGTGINENTLVVDMGDQRNFQYQVAAVEANVPAFGARSAPRGDDIYYRIEVFTQTGSEGYDLMGLSSQQIIDDVLDRYENHLSFLDYSHEHSYQSVITPPAPPVTDSIPAIPVSADEVEEVAPEPAHERGPPCTRTDPRPGPPPSRRPGPQPAGPGRTSGAGPGRLGTGIARGEAGPHSRVRT